MAGIVELIVELEVFITRDCIMLHGQVQTLSAMTLGDNKWLS